MPDPFANMGPSDQATAHLLNVARRHASLECGELIGVMNIKVRETQRVESIAFHCTGPKLHKGACAFLGQDLVVTKRQR